MSELSGKDIAEVIAAGSEKLASVPSGGAVASSSGPAGGAAAAEEKKEESEEEESDDVSFASNSQVTTHTQSLLLSRSHRV